jgi:DivIVA domain-containing protein
MGKRLKGAKKMALSQGEIANHTFSASRGRGFDREEVNAFLQQLAEQVGEMERRIETLETSQDPYQETGEEVTAVLREARKSATEVRARAEQEAKAREQQAAEQAAQLQRETKESAASTLERVREEAATLLQDAQRQTQSQREAAERHSAELIREATAALDTAREQAGRLVQEAQSQAEEQRQATERQCNEMLEAAIRRHERLQVYEGNVRDRANHVERALQALQAALGADLGRKQSGVASQRDEDARGDVADSGDGDAAHDTDAIREGSTIMVPPL